MILGQSQVSWQHFQTPIMNNTGMNVPNISIAPIWTHIASTKPHIWYVKMILVQNQVSRWHFQTPIMNNTGMNVPNISIAPIWTHIASTIPHICQDVASTKLSVKIKNPDTCHEEHWHETLSFVLGSSWHITSEVYRRPFGSRWRLWRHLCRCCSW